MAENAAGSVDALMKAFGYTDSSAFRKRIEQGGLQLTPDKAQAFAKALSDIARSNGALAAVSQKTNAQMQRFLNQLTFAKDEIFKNGMNDGLGYMFNSLSIIMEDLAPLTKVLGGIFKGFVSTMSGLVRVIAAPIGLVVELLESLGITNPKFMAIVGGGGTLALLALRFTLIKNVLFGVNSQLLLMMRHFAKIAILPLMLEDAYSTLQGRETIISNVASLGMNNARRYSANPSSANNDGFFTRAFTASAMPFQLMYDAVTGKSAPTKVTVEVKGEEAAKFINATVEKNTQGKMAATQTEVSQ